MNENDELFTFDQSFIHLSVDVFCCLRSSERFRLCRVVVPLSLFDKS